MAQHFKIRTYHREPICVPAYYLSGDFLGKATVWNISAGGWHLQGDHQVNVGMALSLRIELSPYASAVEIEQARVQWVRGRDFGVRIEKIGALAAKRLMQLAGASRHESFAVRR